jgi:hypothetical protein
MAGHSRSKNGDASLAYVPAIHVFATEKLSENSTAQRRVAARSLLPETAQPLLE